MHQVTADIAAGRLWKARDRLQGMRAQRPADQDVLELLGRVRADMGDLPEAGLAWFLTDGDDPRREEALAAMRERYGGGTSLASRLKVMVAVDAYPPAVQARLRALEQETGRPFLPRARHPQHPVTPGSRLKDTAAVAGCLGALLLMVIPWLIGVKEILD